MNGNTCAASVDVDIEAITPFDPMYEYPCERLGRNTEPLNLFEFVNVLKSPNRVVDAVLSVPVIVTGAEPSTVKPVHDTDPEHVADVVAVVERSPVEPTYVRPCDSEVNLRLDPNVEEAVEKIPPR